jgi:cysteinyl-tRNA synthetase
VKESRRWRWRELRTLQRLEGNGYSAFQHLFAELQEFIPIDPERKRVKLYTCGPTLHNHAHIGNFRTFIFEDLLQRHLEARGYEVERVMNLTDVDDKTIRGCRQLGMRLADFTEQYKRAFF